MCDPHINWLVALKRYSSRLKSLHNCAQTVKLRFLLLCNHFGLYYTFCIIFDISADWEGN